MEKVIVGEEQSQPVPHASSAFTTLMLESLFGITEASLKIKVGEVVRPEVKSECYPIEEDVVNLEEVKPLLELGLSALSPEI